MQDFDATSYFTFLLLFQDMWEKHPTLKALIKMTTSGRYRFPTADCNDEERELMKQVETELRDEVSFVTTRCL